jgi:DNA-binding NarL/FixJ family response regulator
LRKVVQRAQHENVFPEGLLRPVDILVVEDFEPFRQWICSALRERPEFQHVSEASDGLEAIQKIEELRPNLILLDIGLPSLNGIRVAERARTIVPQAKLLFVTQESSPEIIEETFRVGGHGYVQKSRAHSDLLLAVEAVLADKRFVSTGLGFLEEEQTPRGHEIVFCSDDAGLVDSLTSFIATALNDSNAAIVWATESHRKILPELLRSRGVDIDSAIQAGTYVSRDCYEIAEPNHLLELLTGLREAASQMGKQRPRVAACGERAGLLWAAGKTDEAIRLEQLWSELEAHHELDILCVYPAPPDNVDQALYTVCAIHTASYSR